MANKFIVTGEHYFSITGQMLEIQRQIRLKSGSSIDPELVILALQDIIEGNFGGYNKKKDQILNLLSNGESIIIDLCDGSETLNQAKELFTSGIDPDFKNFETDNPGIASKETSAQVYEVVKDATFAQMFGFLGIELNELCFTQAQIKNFCKKHPSWLSQDGYVTFFLFKINNNFFVARVYVGSNGLRVGISKFENSYVWPNKKRHLVIPLKG